MPSRPERLRGAALGLALGAALLAAAPASAAPPRRVPAGMGPHGLRAVGALGLRSVDRRAGLRVDVERVGQVFYLALRPLFAWTDEGDGDPALLVSVPLRFQLLDTRGASSDERFGDLFAFREADWASGWDVLRTVEVVRAGGPERPFEVAIGPFAPLTLGHGTWVDRFDPNLSVGGRRLAVHLAGRTPYGEAELIASDPFEPQVVGLHLSVLPAGAAALGWPSRLALTGTVAADVDAPLMNRLDLFDADRDGRRREVLLTGAADRPAYLDGLVVAWAAGLALRPPAPNRGWSGFFELGGLSGPVPRPCDAWAGPEADHCPTLFGPADQDLAPQPAALQTRRVGALGAALAVSHHRPLADGGQLYGRAEARLGERAAHFRYFDPLYALQRVLYAAPALGPAPDLANRTKARRVLDGPDPDALVPALAVQLHWRSSGGVELAGGLDAAFGAPHGGWFVHLGMPQAPVFGWSLAYHKRATAAADLFEAGQGALFVAAARLTPVPILHLDARALVPVGLDADTLDDRLFDVTLGVELAFDY